MSAKDYQMGSGLKVKLTVMDPGDWSTVAKLPGLDTLAVTASTVTANKLQAEGLTLNGPSGMHLMANSYDTLPKLELKSDGDIMFTDHGGIRRSLKEFYSRFTYVEGQELKRTAPGISSPSPAAFGITPVSKTDHDSAVMRLQTEINNLRTEKTKSEEQFKLILSKLVDRIEALETDMADRPQTSPTWG